MDPATMAMLAATMLPMLMGGGGNSPQIPAPTPAGAPPRGPVMPQPNPFPMQIPGMNPTSPMTPMAPQIGPPMDLPFTIGAGEAANAAASVANPGIQPPSPSEEKGNSSQSGATDWLKASATALQAMAPFLMSSARQVAAPIPGGSAGGMMPGFGLPSPMGLGNYLTSMPQIRR